MLTNPESFAIIVKPSDAGVAQSVEQLICNQQVGGSSPSTSSKIHRIRRTEYGGIPEWPKGTDCKSAGNAFGGSNPPSPTRKTDLFLQVGFSIKSTLAGGWNIASQCEILASFEWNCCGDGWIWFHQRQSRRFHFLWGSEFIRKIAGNIFFCSP